MTTPFGAKIKSLRAKKGVRMKDMATALGVSSAYLSALESGKKGKPSLQMMHMICQYFDIIWDEAEQLAQLAALSQSKVKIDCQGCDDNTVIFVNLLAQNIQKLPSEQINAWLSQLKAEINEIKSL